MTFKISDTSTIFLHAGRYWHFWLNVLYIYHYLPLLFESILDPVIQCPKVAGQALRKGFMEVIKRGGLALYIPLIVLILLLGELPPDNCLPLHVPLIQQSREHLKYNSKGLNQKFSVKNSKMSAKVD